MKYFNAFQLVLLFAAMPFIITWLGKDAEFYGHDILKWVCCGVYLYGFGAMVWLVVDNLTKEP